MDILYFVLIVLFVFLDIKNPTYFVIFYLLLTTKFLGIIDFSLIQIQGMEFGVFGINFLTTILSIKNLKLAKNKLGINGFIILIFLLLVYGILKPVLFGVSGILQSLVASKEFWSYSILFYTIVNKNKINVIKIISFVKILGVYLALIYIIGLVMPDLVPPFYYTDSYVRVAYPSYIVIAIYLLAAEIKGNGLSFLPLIKVGVAFLGLFLSGRFSLNITTFIGVIVIIYGFDRNFKLRRINLIKIIIFSVLSSILILLIDLDLVIQSYELIANIIDGSAVEISSRAQYNEFRFQAINEKKWLGYGFVHHSASIMDSFDINTTNRFTRSFGVIDSGYVDFLIKFGIVGLVLFLFNYCRIIYNSLIIIRRTEYSISMTVFLISLIFINYTWSVLTYPMGIVPMAIAILIINRSVQTQNNINTIGKEN